MNEFDQINNFTLDERPIYKSCRTFIFISLMLSQLVVIYSNHLEVIK